MLSLSVLFAINHTLLPYLVGGSTLFRPHFLYFRTHAALSRSFRSPLLFSSLLIFLVKVLRCFNSLLSAFYSPICFPFLVPLLPSHHSASLRCRIPHSRFSSLSFLLPPYSISTRIIAVSNASFFVCSITPLSTFIHSFVCFFAYSFIGLCKLRDSNS